MRAGTHLNNRVAAVNVAPVGNGPALYVSTSPEFGSVAFTVNETVSFSFFAIAAIAVNVGFTFVLCVRVPFEYDTVSAAPVPDAISHRAGLIVNDVVPPLYTTRSLHKMPVPKFNGVLPVISNHPRVIVVADADPINETLAGAPVMPRYCVAVES